MSADDRPARFDTSAAVLAARFGDVVRSRISAGREDVREIARHAASYGRLALAEQKQAALRVLPFPYRNGDWT